MSVRVKNDKQRSTKPIDLELYYKSTITANDVALTEVMNSLSDHVWIKNIDGIYIFCNQSVQDAWGIKPEDILGKNDFELFDEELARKFIEADKRLVETGKQEVVEECVSTDSSKGDIWLETIKTRIHTKQGDVFGVMGMTRNVTKRKAIENQLSIASKIFNNSKEGMMVTNKRGHIVDINTAFTDITGYAQSEVIGRNPKFLQSGHHDAEFYHSVWDSLNKEGIWKGEFLNRRKDGSFYPQLTTISSIFDEYDNLLNFVAVFEDISFRKAHEEKLQQMAFFDPLTKLPNRASLIKHFKQQINESNTNDTHFATLFLDIDRFKQINDSLGHFAGDKVLTDLSQRLQGVLRKQDFVARLGGDEFVVVIPNIDNDHRLDAVINKLIGLFDDPFKPVDGESVRLSTSIGIAMYPNDGQNGETLLKNADTAMYQAKQNGRNGFTYYTPAQSNEALSHVRIHSALHDALENEQFTLVYQPQFRLAERTLDGFEALIRWNHPQLGNIPPADFIPLAEKSGLIGNIGLWVLDAACKQGVAWLKQGVEFGQIAVNISSQQLAQPDFIRKVTKVLQDTGLPPEHLELEITEGSLLLNPEKAVDDLKVLSELGIEIALDDFGTGYSSMTYLKKLPLHKLKIDASFVHDIPMDQDSNAIANAIIALGNSLSLKVIAEGLETEEQAKYLLKNGCLLGQGYHLGRPVSAAECEKFLN